MQGNWLNEFACRRPLWLPVDDLSPRMVLASRVSISRNLRGMLFTPFAGQEKTAETVCHILHSEISRLPGWDDVTELEPRLMPPDHRAFLRNVDCSGTPSAKLRMTDWPCCARTNKAAAFATTATTCA